MVEILPENEPLTKLLPKVLRARDFHLYLEGGKRLVDLWLQGGKAVLGHKPPLVLRELKNAAERGLFTPLPHHTEGRFLKALSFIFPNRAFRLYSDPSAMFHALREAGFSGAILDPAFPKDSCPVKPEEENIWIWRPFLTGPKDEGKAGKERILIPVLPWPLGPSVLIIDINIEASFHSGEIIPPVLLAPAARALYDLAAAMKAPDQGRQKYHQIEKILSTAKQSGAGSGGIWQRRGIYLTIKADREKYTELFQRFLSEGFLLPPSTDEPIILPASMSKGEEAKLANLLKSTISP